jgi:outer membrane protein, multidrug efflux system
VQNLRGRGIAQVTAVFAVAIATTHTHEARGAATGAPPEAVTTQDPGAPATDPMLAPPPPAPRQLASWDEAIALVRAQSPEYLSTYQSVVRAEGQKRIALAAVLPILNGQASYTRQLYTTTISLGSVSFVTPPADLWSIGGSASWNVLNPRAIYAIGTANENIGIAKLSFADQRRVIALSLVQTMLSTLAAARVAELNRVGLRSALERLTLTQARLQYGQGTALDVDRAQRDTDDARRLIISGDESLRQTREALGVALGSEIALAAPGDLDLEQFETAVAGTCRLNDDVERRPDVVAARERVVLAERTVHDAELLFAPLVNVSSQFNHSNVAVLGPLTTWSVGATVVVPFYDGGARYGAMRDARAALQQARDALVTTRLNAIVGSAQAQRSVGVLRASLEVARQQRDLARRIDERTRDGYAHGLGTSLDLVTSAQSLRQAEIDLAILEYQFAQARANAIITNAECLY